jgi:hypothetical protein
MDLSIFNTASLFDAATDLFKQLNITLNSNTSESLPKRDVLKNFYRESGIFQEIRNTYFIGIIDDSIFREVGLFDERYSYKQALEQSDRNYDGLMFFALELTKHPTRAEISDLTRAFNRISQKMPVGLLLKYDNSGEVVISITISERFKYKQNWRQGEKAGKVIILRDIHTITTHAGHIRILKDLVKPVAVTTYSQLHEHWLQVLDVNILNKRFFQELANWYFWAMDIVEFPDDVEKDKEVRNATNLIRLITRVIFIWFIKEKKLVPNNLFRKDYLQEIVADFMKNIKSENFYLAILQNLFFGTLNQVIEDRDFVKEGSFHENREEYGVKNLFRYSDKFSISKNEVKALFKDIPFLNGGLFDCLDKPDDDGKIIYVDGFSRNPKKQSHIPDNVFFSDEIEIDLNEIYGTRSKRYKVQGLINLLDSYKFTVAENTPIEEEIALDPELLGKVFENLLASYNPETKTTARKQTGSFYTPREIVNYMVDESLIEYLKQNCKTDSQSFENNLKNLFSYSEDVNPFDDKESKSIIKALNQCRILDPACGSGAFPMGILHKMVYILNKLDPDNSNWKQLQKERAIEETNIAYDIKDHDERKKRLDEIEDVFDNNISDYGRKLYLIENCIYGIDIQPIAVQIAKLRFFISLIIDQNKFEDRENYGIRSLPNLETKFVAANTLISLDKPQLTTGDIFLNDTYQEINKLSSQLKEIRHKYFNAKKRNEKLYFQEKDKSIRRKISEHLVKIGHTSLNAHKIASFDPYDQNHFADWFEPEWMFGGEVEEGFHIVIGNPPYVVTRRDLYTNYEWVGDLYTIFFELSVKTLLRSKGILSFITPRFFLFNQINSDMRRYLIEDVHIISMTECNPFDAVTENEITILMKSHPQFEYINFYIHEDEKIRFLNRIKKDWIRANKQYEINPYITEDVFHLLTKIKGNHKLLSDISVSKRGAEIGKSELRNSVNGKYILLGYDVSRFHIAPTGARIKTSHKEYQRLHRIFNLPKIVLLRRVSKDLIASISQESMAFSKNLYAIIPYEGYSHELICGLLNSKALNFYYKKKFSTKKEEVFPEIQTYLFEQLPIYLSNEEIQNAIIRIVSEIIEKLKANPDEDISNLENELNSLVSSYYSLDEKDIQLIEDMTVTHN